MKFEELKIKGAYLITLEPFMDERGSFARQFCKKEFEKAGIDFNICQCNISESKKRGTIRGMHYQKSPYLEPKMVSCIKGSLFDVIVDLRKDSPTYLEWIGTELTESNNKLLYIPPLVAHGFQTLEDNSTIFYQLGEFFQPDYYDGIRYNDPAVNIKWKPIEPVITNERDKNYTLLNLKK